MAIGVAVLKEQTCDDGSLRGRRSREREGEKGWLPASTVTAPVARAAW